MQYFGADALLRMISHLTFIYVAFWSLQALNVQQLFKAYKSGQIRIFFVLLSIVLGYLSSSFFLEIIYLCKNLFLTPWM